jgi:hypothetical protein
MVCLSAGDVLTDGQFQREKMHFWTGEQGEAEYAGESCQFLPYQNVALMSTASVEVDDAVAQTDGTGGRGSNGLITQALDDDNVRTEVERSAV